MQYQTERQDNELERVFDERKETSTQGTTTAIAAEHLGKKNFKEPETEWQKTVKSKKDENYYSKLIDVEEEQIFKESRLRHANHQLTIPGENVPNNLTTKAMAQKYDKNL